MFHAPFHSNLLPNLNHHPSVYHSLPPRAERHCQSPAWGVDSLRSWPSSIQSEALSSCALCGTATLGLVVLIQRHTFQVAVSAWEHNREVCCSIEPCPGLVSHPASCCAMHSGMGETIGDGHFGGREPRTAGIAHGGLVARFCPSHPTSHRVRLRSGLRVLGQNSTTFFFSSFLLSICWANSQPTIPYRRSEVMPYPQLLTVPICPMTAVQYSQHHCGDEWYRKLREGQLLGQAQRTGSSPGTWICRHHSDANIVCSSPRFLGRDRETCFGSSCSPDASR